MAICHCGEMDSICSHSPCHDTASHLWDQMKMNGIEFQDFYDEFWVRNAAFLPDDKKITDNYWIDFKKFKLLVRDCGLSFSYHNIPMQMYLITDLIDEMVANKKAEREAISEEEEALTRFKVERETEARMLKEKFRDQYIKNGGVDTKNNHLSNDVRSDEFNTLSKIGMEQVSTKPTKSRASGDNQPDSEAGVESRTTINITNNFTVESKTNRFANIGT